MLWITHGWWCRRPESIRHDELTFGSEMVIFHCLPTLSRTPPCSGGQMRTPWAPTEILGLKVIASLHLFFFLLGGNFPFWYSSTILKKPRGHCYEGIFSKQTSFSISASLWSLLWAHLHEQADVQRHWIKTRQQGITKSMKRHPALSLSPWHAVCQVKAGNKYSIHLNTTKY